VLAAPLGATTLASPASTPLVLRRAGSRAASRVVTRIHAKRRAARPALRTYFTAVFGIANRRLELARLRVGSHVLAGTILGHLKGSAHPHLSFGLAPASGRTTVDARPFLDAWSQLGSLELHRHGVAPLYYGPNAHATSAGTVLVSSQVDLARAVLGDPRVTLAGCERAAIAAGNVSRPVLAALEMLALHHIHASVSGAWCASPHSTSAGPALLRTGNAIALFPGGSTPTTTALAAAATRALAPLRGALRPAVTTGTLSGRVLLSFTPVAVPQALAASAAFTGGFALSPARWASLDARLGQIAEPRMPIASSTAALRDPQGGGSTRRP